MKRGLFILVVVAMMVLGGCSEKAPVDSVKDTAENGQEDSKELEASKVLNLDETVEISVNWNAGETSTLLGEKFMVEKSGYAAGQNSSYDNTVIGYNEKYAFYHKGYIEDMAQDYNRYEIYSYHMESGETSLLYEKASVRINEMCMNDAYLYWVEEQADNYQIMQLAIDSKEVKCIAQYSGNVMSPCLEASEDYVVWDEDDGNGEVKLVVWNVGEQKLNVIEQINTDENRLPTKFMPWSRLKIVDGYITFFTQDEEDNVYVNRYRLQDGHTDTIAIGNQEKYKKLSGCFSNGEYIGWFTEYSVGTFYFYELETGNLSKWVLDDKHSIFSFALYDKLYVNTGDKILVYDMDKKSTLKCSLEGTALQFKQSGEEVWIEIITRDKNGIWVLQN